MVKRSARATRSTQTDDNSAATSPKAAELPPALRSDDKATADIFTRLIFGLEQYLEQGTSALNLRLARHALALEMGETYPKTFHAFLQRCEAPVAEWYLLLIPPEFPRSGRILYDGMLSEEAQLYSAAVAKRLSITEREAWQVSRSALDNLLMVDLLQHLRAQPNRAVVQAHYTAIRSFVITNSCFSTPGLRRFSSDPVVTGEIQKFYEEAPFAEGEDFAVCDICGVLHFHDGRWHGVRPQYCDDHDDLNARHIHVQPAPRNLYVLKRGLHLRTFLPGRAELRLFEWAESLHESYPAMLQPPERYPGLDAYDLRLTFSNSEAWAIDVKDHASPESLRDQIRRPYGEGDLAYTRAFFVIPERRLQMRPDYLFELKRLVGQYPPDVQVMGEADFRQHTETEIARLARAAGKSAR